MSLHSLDLVIAILRKHGNQICDLCQILVTSVTLEDNVCFVCKRLDRSKNVRFDDSKRSFRWFKVFDIFHLDRSKCLAFLVSTVSGVSEC